MRALKRTAFLLALVTALGPLPLALAQEPPSYEGWLDAQEAVYPELTIEAEIPGAPLALEQPGDQIDITVQVQKAGLYQLELDARALPARRGVIEYSILINGEIPFRQAERVLARRVFEAAGPIERDSRGHDTRPDMVEMDLVQTLRPGDHNNHYAQPFYFHFRQGENTVSLRLLAERLAIHGLRLASAVQLPDYAGYFAALPDAAGGAESVVIQAEEAGRRSAETFYALAARGDASLTPSDPVKTRLNTIGGYAWKQQGDWIEWPVEIKQTGWYSLRLHALNDFVRGMPTTRRLYVDGAVPFLEAQALSMRARSHPTATGTACTRCRKPRILT